MDPVAVTGSSTKENTSSLLMGYFLCVKKFIAWGLVTRDTVGTLNNQNGGHPRANYEHDFEDTHEVMHQRRKEQRYKGRKLSAAIHRNELERGRRSRGSTRASQMKLMLE